MSGVRSVTDLMATPVVDWGEPLLTAPEVAKMLGVEKSWVHRAAREGRIPVVQLGRYQRFRRQAIEDWIKSQERPAA